MNPLDDITGTLNREIDDVLSMAMVEVDSFMAKQRGGSQYDQMHFIVSMMVDYIESIGLDENGKDPREVENLQCLLLIYKSLERIANIELLVSQTKLKDPKLRLKTIAEATKISLDTIFEKEKELCIFVIDAEKPRELDLLSTLPPRESKIVLLGGIAELDKQIQMNNADMKVAH